jgi:hypothetical protein
MSIDYLMISRIRTHISSIFDKLTMNIMNNNRDNINKLLMNIFRQNIFGEQNFLTKENKRKPQGMKRLRIVVNTIFLLFTEQE